MNSTSTISNCIDLFIFCYWLCLSIEFQPDWYIFGQVDNAIPIFMRDECSVCLFIYFLSWLQQNKAPIPMTIIFGLHKQTRRTHVSIETCIYVDGTFEISYSNDATNMDTLKLKFCIIDEMLCMHKPHVLNSHISWPNPIMLRTISKQKNVEWDYVDFYIVTDVEIDTYAVPLCYAHVCLFFLLNSEKG